MIRKIQEEKGMRERVPVPEPGCKFGTLPQPELHQLAVENAQWFANARRVRRRILTGSSARRKEFNPAYASRWLIIGGKHYLH